MLKSKLTRGTGTSAVVSRCQACNSRKLESIIFLGYLPPVNTMPKIGTAPAEQPAYPAELLRCPRCELVQLGLVVDPKILFPPEYPYTSGTTRILRENFAELYEDRKNVIELAPEDLVIDIGSNDGTLLSNFVKKHRVHGIEPTDVGRLAVKRGISTTQAFFGAAVAKRVRRENGPAKLVTATNVFAHIEDVHSILESILLMLDDDGVFVSESHYLDSLIRTVQYDTIYHEHLRYYSLTSLAHLLKRHGLEVVHAKRIPTHGGSIRVYAARKGRIRPTKEVERILKYEKRSLAPARLLEFKKRTMLSKLGLHSLLLGLLRKGKRIYGIGAPSRASTLLNYTGIDDEMLDCVLEIKGSIKIGKYMPGTRIPVLDESRLFEDPPDYALVLSWHIHDELIPKLAKKGYAGDFIVPLPEPRIVRNPSGRG